jgi:antitoxin YefM
MEAPSREAQAEGSDETLYILLNQSLMEQIERSMKTHQEGTGYRPSVQELNWDED